MFFLQNSLNQSLTFLEQQQNISVRNNIIHYILSDIFNGSSEIDYLEQQQNISVRRGVINDILSDIFTDSSEIDYLSSCVKFVFIIIRLLQKLQLK